MNNVEKFLANNTKGFEARKELFEIISNELYSIFYENKKVDFNVNLVFEEWINQIGFFGESINSLKILFYVLNNKNKFLDYHYKAVKGCFCTDNQKWLHHFEKLTEDEALLLYKMINN